MDTNKASNPQPLSPTLTGTGEDGLPPRTVKAVLAEGHLAIQAEISRLIEPLVVIGDPDLNDRLFRLLAMIWAAPAVDPAFDGVVEDFATLAMYVHTSHGYSGYRALIEAIAGQPIHAGSSTEPSE